jgi:hypothetical protein
MRCEVFGLVQCPHLAIETMVYLNPRCAGKGSLALCASHLRRYLEEQT